MIIGIGSTNIVKVEAVEEIIRGYPLLADATCVAVSAPSGVDDQPMSLEETIRGAKNRAKNAFVACDYSFGIESGLFEAPGSATGYLEACVCAIFDGTNYHLGLSCGFEVPPALLSLILKEKMTLGDACYQSGISTNTNLGSAEGLIGILSKNRINRKIYTQQAVMTALIQLENADWYVTPILS